MMRTKLSVCNRKRSYGSAEDALIVALTAEAELRAYRCDRCRLFHLTSRTKGKPVLRRRAKP